MNRGIEVLCCLLGHGDFISARDKACGFDVHRLTGVDCFIHLGNGIRVNETVLDVAVDVDVATTGGQGGLGGSVEKVRGCVDRAVFHGAVINQLVRHAETNDCEDEKACSTEKLLHVYLSRWHFHLMH